MRIAVFGTGVVGRTMAAALSERGHDVTIGTRDVEATMTRSDPKSLDKVAYANWASDHPSVALATFSDAAQSADLIVNATEGSASLTVLRAAGSDNLAGKVLVDISNGLDFSKGFPPTLIVANTDSLGEQIQREFPEARVVKTLNTVNAALMVDPSATLPHDCTVFVAGNDVAAKRSVVDLLKSLGQGDVIDLGGIESARATEMYLPLWLRLMSSFGTPNFSIKVVR